MLILKQKKLKNKKIIESINIMRDFLEGKMSVYDFWEKFINEEIIRNILITDSIKHRKFSTYYDPESLLDRVNFDKLRDRVEIFWMVERYFKNNKISAISYNDDEKYFMFISQIQPSWLELEEEFLNNIVKTIPKGNSKTDSIKFCKTKIKELFKYEDKPPKWLQNPEWPIINGKPLVFKYQTDDVDDYLISKINYYFYNPDSGEEVIIEQFD